MQTRSNPANKPNQNHHPAAAKTTTKPASISQTKAQPTNTKTPPTYPFPAYIIVKEQNPSRPVKPAT
jgi:hypothetical protein